MTDKEALEQLIYMLENYHSIPLSEIIDKIDEIKKLDY